MAQRLDSSERKVLIQGGTYARYVPTGHLLYVHAGTLMAAPFDLERLEVTAPAVPVVESVMVSLLSGGAQFDISNAGSLVYVSGGAQALERLSLVWVDRKGVAQPIPAPPRSYQNPRLSPDGRQVAVSIMGESKLDIWVYDLARDTLTRLTFEGTGNNFPLWTPDGRRVAYRSSKGGPQNLFWKPADGSGPEERLTTSEYLNTALSFSPDGRILIYAEQNPKTGYDLWALPLEGERKPRLILQTPFNERVARFSPDGRWLAYVSDESGQYEVYVQPFPGPGGKHQISTEGGSEIFWGQSGELFYRTGANREKMMAVDVNQSRDSNGAVASSLTAGKPRLLFEGPYANNAANGSWTADYSVTPDGQRFLMLKPAESEAAALTQINVVLNWFEELKQKVPVK